MAITEYMDEREHSDFDVRLLAEAKGSQRPSEGVEKLWGLMGRPSVAPGAGAAPGAAQAPRRPTAARGIGETP